MNKEKFLKFLRKSSACSPAIEWAAKTNDLKAAWQQCERGDWMLWLIRKIMNNDEPSLRKLTLAKARCARLVIHLMKDERSKMAVEIAEKFGNGEATREELDAAYAAAATAATAATADAATTADARKNILLQCANVIRELYSYDEVLAMIR